MRGDILCSLTDHTISIFPSFASEPQKTSHIKTNHTVTIPNQISIVWNTPVPAQLPVLEVVIVWNSLPQWPNACLMDISSNQPENINQSDHSIRSKLPSNKHLIGCWPSMPFIFNFFFHSSSNQLILFFLNVKLNSLTF